MQNPARSEMPRDVNTTAMDLDGERSATTISVIVPCLDEEATIGTVIREAWAGINATGTPGEVLVVDNGSTDHSREIAHRYGARVIVELRRGYGNAYLTGLRAARGQFLVMADGDGTYDVSHLKLFVERLEQGDDVVLGSRFKGAIEEGAMPWMHRRIGNPLLTKILNGLYDVDVSDAHCGLRAVRRDALPLLRLRSTGMEFASEMVLKAARAGLRIGEVPVSYRRRGGASKLRPFRDAWRHLRLLLLYTPTKLFFVPGTALLTLGMAVVVPLALGPIHLFGRLWGIHSMIAGAAAVLVGFQIVLLGLFARTYAVIYMGDKEPRLQRLWTRIRLEHGLAAGIILFLAGLGIVVAIFLDWASDGFGNLALGHQALIGMILIAIGVQTIFGSFFLSILGLQERNAVEGGGAEQVHGSN